MKDPAFHKFLCLIFCFGYKKWNTDCISCEQIRRIYFALDRAASVTGPSMSAATAWKRIPTLKGLNSAVRCLPAVVRAAHGRHQESFFSMSRLMKSHQNLCLIRISVFSTLKWPPLTGEVWSWSKISFLQERGTINCKCGSIFSGWNQFLYKTRFLRPSSAHRDQ